MERRSRSAWWALALLASLLVAPLRAQDIPPALKDWQGWVLHDVPEQVHILREVQRLLKPGGVYFLIEWDKIATDFGPPLEIRFRPSDLRDTLLEHHFNPVRQIPAPQPWFQVLAIKPALQ